jgi:hypothetical protein
MSPGDHEESYRSWLKGEAPTAENLQTYVASLDEGWNSEYKAAANDDRMNIRKAVAALGNTAGGEVFLGVANDKTVQGTLLKSNELTDILKQSGAQPASWYSVDLNDAVVDSLTVTLSKGTKPRHAYVLTVARLGVPVLVDEGGELKLYLRRRDQSVPASGFEALGWNREVNREYILRTCFKEFRSVVNHVDFNFPQALIGRGWELPFLGRRLEDGSIYNFLLEQDMEVLFGKRQPGGAISRGVISRFFSIRLELVEIRRRPDANKRLSDWAVSYGKSWDTQFQEDLRAFAEYLRGEGIDTSMD